MAQNVEYILRVKGLTGSDDGETFHETPTPPSGLATGLKGLNDSLHPIKALIKHRQGEGVETYLVKESADKAIQLVTTGTNLTLGRYFRLSEDYKSQNNLSNAMANINKAKGFAGSVFSGGMAGLTLSGGNPIGAVLGMAIGGAVNAAQQKIEWDNRIANFNMSMNATRTETSYRAKRAGLYDGGKGTEN